MGIGFSYRWQQGNYDGEVPTGSDRTVREEIEEAVRQINTARFNKPGRPSGVTNLVIDNDLMQAAMEDAARWQGGAETEETAKQFADRHLFAGQAVERIWAQESANIIELCDALVKDPATAAVIDDPKWGVVGAAIGGSQYNLYLVVYFGERDPLATHGPPRPEAFTAVCLPDGLEFGDPTGDRKIATGVG